MAIVGYTRARDLRRIKRWSKEASGGIAAMGKNLIWFATEDCHDCDWCREVRVLVLVAITDCRVIAALNNYVCRISKIEGTLIDTLFVTLHVQSVPTFASRFAAAAKTRRTCNTHVCSKILLLKIRQYSTIFNSISKCCPFWWIQAWRSSKIECIVLRIPAIESHD